MIDHDMPVRVFKNLKHDCYSIMQCGQLKASAKQVILADVEFRVRESGRQKMLRERKKNVHAFVIGRLVEFVHADEPRNLSEPSGRGAIYDPYRFATFVDRETQAPLKNAALAHFGERGLHYA